MMENIASEAEIIAYYLSLTCDIFPHYYSPSGAYFITHPL